MCLWRDQFALCKLCFGMTHHPVVLVVHPLGNVWIKKNLNCICRLVKLNMCLLYLYHYYDLTFISRASKFCWLIMHSICTQQTRRNTKNIPERSTGTYSESNEPVYLLCQISNPHGSVLISFITAIALLSILAVAEMQLRLRSLYFLLSSRERLWTCTSLLNPRGSSHLSRSTSRCSFIQMTHSFCCLITLCPRVNTPARALSARTSR